MPQYNIGLGVDAGPNNYFDFDWQIDGRPAVPNEGFEISIDLSNFAAQQGTSLNLLDDINTEKLLDIIIADDTLVDFVELTVYFPSTSSSTSSGSITTPQKLGSEFQVNTHTIGDQSLPDITALSDGGFVATWVSAGQDGDNDGIYGQRYNAAGTAVGTEFRINSTISNSQNSPSVASLSGGGFVVSWNSYFQDGSFHTIISQIYDASGSKSSPEIQSNTYTANNQTLPSIAGLEDGGFVVTWGSQLQDGADYEIYGQRHSANGAKVGTEFKVNTYDTDRQLDSDVTSLKDGGFVVTWASNGQDGSGYGIYGQRYDASGSASGSEFLINTHTANDQNMPSVASLSNGDFVVTWHSHGQDGDGDSGGSTLETNSYGQLYDSSGSRIGTEFLINTETASYQGYPSITGLKDGGFVVTWQSYYQDGEGYGIYGQKYDSSGNVAGSEFQVSTFTPNRQAQAQVTTLSDGGLVVTWNSFAQDGDGYGIYAQIFDTGSSSSSSSGSGSSFSSSGPTLDSSANAMVAITAVDKAIQTVNIQRSKLGAVSNRLSHTVNNLTNISSNLSAAQGSIEDADFAKETTDLAKNQILQQASTAMLAQANASKQNVLSLLQG